MDAETTARLIEINRRFYDEFGQAFAETRRRIQDGVRRALSLIPDRVGGRWLDLGCGSGALAAEWLTTGRRSAYLGLDFSGPLLEEARKTTAGLPGAEQVRFAGADLGSPDWHEGIEPGLDGVLAFAVLHHIPSAALREQLLHQTYQLLVPGGWFIFSVWQFNNSPKLAARVLPWPAAGLDPNLLEPGDTLLDWRHALPGQDHQVGLRYVHHFSREELEGLAARGGFQQVDWYESDGQGGRLGLYQVWKKR